MDWSDLSSLEGHVIQERFRLENAIGPNTCACLRQDDRRTGLFHLLRRVEGLDLGVPSRPPHPAFTPIWAYGDLDDTWAFLITPLPEGDSLDDLLEEGPLPADRVCKLLHQLATALAAMHQQNQLLLNLNTIDVRVVSAWQGHDRLHLPAHPALLGEAAGRRFAGYCAPEVDPINAGRIDARADQFCLGVIAFELLTGTTPHNPEAAPGDRTQMPVLPHPDVPEALEPILKTLLQGSAGHRYPTDMALLDAIAEAEATLVPTESYGQFTPVILPVRSNPRMSSQQDDPASKEHAAPWDSNLAMLVLLLIVFLAALGASTTLVLGFL